MLMSLSSEEGPLLPGPRTLRRQEPTGPGLSVGHHDTGTERTGNTANGTRLLLWGEAATDRME